MYNPSLKEFLKLSKLGNVIPLYKEINADLDTPVSAFLKIKKNDYAFLLESVEGKEKVARFSFLGSNPSMVFKSKGRNIEVSFAHKKKTIKKQLKRGTPLDEIEKIMRDFKSVHIPGLPRFYGGLVGYIGYDMVRFFEDIPDKNPDDLKIPDAVFILTNTILIIDHARHTIKIVKNIILPRNSSRIRQGAKTKFYAQALKEIELIHRQLKKPLKKNCTKALSSKAVSKRISSNMSRAAFQAMVKKAKGYIREGEVIQAVLSQRFKLNLENTPFDAYRNLRSLNPSPYMFFLRLKGITLVGSSPEMLLRCEDGFIQTRPIAGTRPRGRTRQEDDRLTADLLKDKKERAEHLMLVDLGRNDLGRVALKGTVKVNQFMQAEKYSHVIHLVSEVKAKLDRSRYNIYDCLKAAFPAGTVSGSPKIRAMEIIDELENLRRGPYAGCVGYFSFSHNMDTCITIRTIVIKGKRAYIQAGAGIVADSLPVREYQETVNKARAQVEAIIGAR